MANTKNRSARYLFNRTRLLRAVALGRVLGEKEIDQFERLVFERTGLDVSNCLLANTLAGMAFAYLSNILRSSGFAHPEIAAARCLLPDGYLLEEMPVLVQSKPALKLFRFGQVLPVATFYSYESYEPLWSWIVNYWEGVDSVGPRYGVEEVDELISKFLAKPT